MFHVQSAGSHVTPVPSDAHLCLCLCVCESMRVWVWVWVWVGWCGWVVLGNNVCVCVCVCARACQTPSSMAILVDTHNNNTNLIHPQQHQTQHTEPLILCMQHICMYATHMYACQTHVSHMPCSGIGSSQGFDRSFGIASMRVRCCCSLSSLRSFASADCVCDDRECDRVWV